MRRYYGSSSSDEGDDEPPRGEEEEEEFKPSPMDLSSLGRGTPLFLSPGARDVPWITDEQELPTGGGGSRPEFLTRSHEGSPLSVKRPLTKRRLGFEGGEEEARMPDMPAFLPMFELQKREEEEEVLSIMKPRGRPSLYDVAPYGDVDFLRLAREQAERAGRLGVRPPGEAFIDVEAEHSGLATRIERVLTNTVARYPGVPVIVVYANDPDLDTQRAPLMFWRSSPADSRMILHMAVIDHYDKTRLDTRLVVNGPASAVLTHVDLFREAMAPVNFQIRSVDDAWNLEGGTFLPPGRAFVVLMQESTMRPPQILELKPLRFEAKIETPVAIPIGNRCRPDEWSLIQYFNEPHIRIDVLPTGHVSVRLASGSKLVQYMKTPQLFATLVCMEHDKFRSSENFQSGASFIQKFHVNTGVMYRARTADVPELAAAMMRLV